MQSVNDNRIPADIRRKKLRFRAWHRGMKEMDIILGNFADKNLEAYEDAELDVFEALLHVPDQPFYAMLMGDAPVPAEIDSPILRQIMEFSQDPLEKR